MRKWKKWEMAFFRLLLLVVIAVALAAVVVRRGFNARDEPSAVETVARLARRMSVPSAMKNANNPSAATTFAAGWIPRLMRKTR